MSNQSQITQKLPATPDWSKAPKWANYFAIDGKGVGYWHEKTPFRMGESWHNFATVAKAGLFNSIDWESSFQRRPKIEGVQPDEIWTDEVVAVTDGLKQRSKPLQITCHFNTDISGYLAGKNSFITGLVDLLLARMAKEERFSDDENRINYTAIEPFDVIVMSVYGGQIYYVVSYSDQERFDVSFGIVSNLQGELCGSSADNYFWHGVHKARTITELEAVEFRKAMEAVYG